VKSISGVVANIRHGIEVRGGRDRSQTIHTAVATVDGNPVEIRATTPIHISDGETVVIAGKEKDGRTVSLAYRNLNNGAFGGESIGLCTFFGLLATLGSIIPLVLIIQELSSSTPDASHLAFSFAGLIALSVGSIAAFFYRGKLVRAKEFVTHFKQDGIK